MGIFDSIKNALGGDDEQEGTKGPSMLLREVGIDPSDLDFSFNADGSVTMTGYVADEATRAKVEEIVGGIKQVSSVTNQLVVGAPPAPEQPPAPEPESEPQVESGEAAVAPTEAAAPPAATEASAAESPAAAGKTYTVQSGDSLWKIAEAQLGSGARYTEIFEANRDILDNPDLIKPGQVLRIP